MKKYNTKVGWRIIRKPVQGLVKTCSKIKSRPGVRTAFVSIAKIRIYPRKRPIFLRFFYEAFEYCFINLNRVFGL